MRLQNPLRGFSSIALLLFLLVASVPEAQASSVTEKFPTSTSVIVAGWNNPENAFANDDSYANSSTSGATQNYTDFGFDVPVDATIEHVSLYIEAYGETYSDGSTPMLWVIAFYGAINTTYEATLVYVYGVTELNGGILLEAVFYADLSSWITTPEEVNSISIQVRSDINFIVSGCLYIDYVSVEVAYTTEEAANMLPVGFLLATLIILPIGILIAKKH